MLRLPLVLAAVLAAALLAGCSGQQTSTSAGDFKGADKAVAQVVDDLAKAGKKGDAKQICTGILAPELAQRLRQGTRDCQAIVDDQLTDAHVFNLDVKSVTIDGEKAAAQVKSTFDGNDQLRTLNFRRVGTTWRVVSMGAAG